MTTSQFRRCGLYGYAGRMDKTELTQEFSSRDCESGSGLGEYVWFAVILLCIVSLVAFQTHG